MYGFQTILTGPYFFVWAVEPVTSLTALICILRQIAPVGSLRLDTALSGDQSTPRQGEAPGSAQDARSGRAISSATDVRLRERPHSTFRDNR